MLPPRRLASCITGKQDTALGSEIGRTEVLNQPNALLCGSPPYLNGRKMAALHFLLFWVSFGVPLHICCNPQTSENIPASPLRSASRALGFSIFQE